MSKRVLYLGWIGKGNVGDDLLFEIFKKMIYEEASQNDISLIVDGYFISNNYYVDLFQYDVIVLGGGSLLAIDYWEKICLKANELGIPTIIWGTGIDNRNKDEVEKIISLFNSGKEYAFWNQQTLEVIKKSELASVRGNIDRYLLNNSNINVIGDPCIIFDRLNNKYPVIKEIDYFIDKSDNIVLVNWGTSYNNIIGNNEQEIELQLEIAIQILLNNGYKIIIYPIWTEDIKPCKELADKFNDENLLFINKVYDVYYLASLLRSAKFTINLKLHANILSMAMAKPFISLGYGLKCYDFIESIDCMDLLLFTDKLNAGHIISKVEHIENNYDALISKFNSKIDYYYKKQFNFIDQVISRINESETQDAKSISRKDPNQNLEKRIVPSLSAKVPFKRKGKNVEIEVDNQFVDPQNIEIGDNVYIGIGGFFIGSGGIKIGNGTIIAHNVEIMTRNHNYDSKDLKSIPYDNRYILKPVIIEENVWIGGHVSIVPGVTIGEGAVIGMSAVITKDVPKYAVVGGNPAKVIKYRNKEMYEKLKKEGKIYLEIKNTR